jgi:hypothetical protein
MARADGCSGQTQVPFRATEGEARQPLDQSHCLLKNPLSREDWGFSGVTQGRKQPRVMVDTPVHQSDKLSLAGCSKQPGPLQRISQVRSAYPSPSVSVITGQPHVPSRYSPGSSLGHAPW